LGVESGNIDKNINQLKELSEQIQNVKIIKGSPGCNLHMAAQMAANSSSGDYVIIALLANYRFYEPERRDGCHHMGIVVKDKLSDNPMIGQGGLSPKYRDKIFAPASWSFSWSWKNSLRIKNKYCMVYVKYGLRD
jgi:hypothetical protein